MRFYTVFCIFISTAYIAAQNQENVSRCPSNLIRGQFLHTHGNYCYEFGLAQHKFWRSAREYCSKNGGYLAKIDNMDQELFLVSTLTHLGFHGKAIWIGLNDIDQEGVYRWANGEVATFTYWAPGEPSFTHNFEDCVALKVTSSGHWHDFPCELIFDDFSWICQYDMLPQSTADPGLILGGLTTTVTQVTQQSTVTGSTLTSTITATTADSGELVGK